MEFSIEALRELPFFSSLNNDDLSQIFQKFEKCELAAEEFLFREDEPGDSLYILIKGKLSVTTKNKLIEKTIGFVKPGELVGELTIFSNEPRSASVRAVYQSTVLRLKREDLKSICHKSPHILWEITKLISARSQSNISIIRDGAKNKNQIISIVYIEENIEAKAVLEEFQKQNSNELRIHFIDYNSIKSDKNKFKSIKKVAEEGYTCICLISHHDLPEANEALTLSDKIIIMQNSNCKDLSSLRDLLTKQIDIIHIEKELILLHDIYKPAYPNTNQFLDLSNFSRNYHISFESPLTIRRLLRLLSGHATGLVVSGGGAKGWAAMGAIKAFYEQDIEIDYVGGTSIGSCVAAAFALSKNLEQFLSLFATVTDPFRRSPFKIRNMTLPLVSLLNGASQTNNIKELCGDSLIQDLTMPFFSISCNLSTYCEHIWDKGYLWQACRASVAIPPLFPPVTYNNQIYVDGGVLNNFPTDVINNKLENQGYIIGIDISSSKPDEQNYNFPPIITFWEAIKIKYNIGRKKTNFIGIIEIMERIMMIASIGKTTQNTKKCDLLIKPNLDDFKFSDFAKKNQMAEIGYREASKELSKWKKKTE